MLMLVASNLLLCVTLSTGAFEIGPGWGAPTGVFKPDTPTGAFGPNKPGALTGAFADVGVPGHG
jgi:hypothetical protein